jgi:drug/metabolite transporter (DMT)-like permease
MSEPAISLRNAKISMLVSAILMGTVGLFVSVFQSAIVAACLRGLFAFIFLSLLFVFNKKYRSGLKYLKPVWKFMVADGINLALMQVFYFSGMFLGGYAMAAFFLYTGGAIALVLNKLILKEEITAQKWVSIILAVIGVAIMLEPWRNENLETFGPLSLLFGILSGIALGISILIKKLSYRKLDKINPDYKENFGFYSGIALCRTFILGFALLPFAFSNLILLTGKEWIVSIFLGLITGAIAFSLYNYGLKEDNGGNIIILSYIEPFVASIVNIILLNELSVGIFIGGILIVGANLIILKSEKGKNSNRPTKIA